MASKMAIIFKENCLYVRTSSGQAEIFRIGPEKSVEQHTKSPEESPWSFPRNPRWRQKWPSFKKNFSSRLEIAHNNQNFLVYLRKYGQTNTLKVLESPSAAFQKTQDGVQNGRHLKNHYVHA